MNIAAFAEYLNKNKKLYLDAQYYTNVSLWKSWWKGAAPFHDVQETLTDGTIQPRRRRSLNMARFVCEDWASLLINDKTLLKVQDADSARWLLGDADQTGGQLGTMRFWPEANTLVAKAFRSGTGAFVLYAENMRTDGVSIQPDPETRIYCDCLPAECILPITVRHGKVEECAFASEVMVQGKPHVYLQTHRLGKQGYVITNEYFLMGENDSFSPVPLPQGLAPHLETGAFVPLFALFSPALEKVQTGGAGLGAAVFAGAIDALEVVDMAFDNFGQDIYLGGKKVFYSGRMVKNCVDANGKPYKVTPDRIRQQTFVEIDGDSADPDKPREWHEYNPDLRVDQNCNAIQHALDYLSFSVGLGTHRYQFHGGAIATATQYSGDRQDMIQHANRHFTQIEAALIQTMRGLLWLGRYAMGAAVDPDTNIAVSWDDSYIMDAGERRRQDMQDANAGFIPRWMYNAEWRGMSEEEARKAVREAQAEQGAFDPLTFVPGGDA